MAQHLYKNYGVPHFENEPFQGIVPPKFNNTLKKGKLVQGGSIQIVDAEGEYSSTPSASPHFKVWKRVGKLIELNNYMEFNGSLDNDKGCCILAVPAVRKLHPYVIYEEATNSWYMNYNKIDTYVTWDYFLISNQFNSGFKVTDNSNRYIRYWYNGEYDKTKDNFIENKEKNNTLVISNYNYNQTIKTWFNVYNNHHHIVFNEDGTTPQYYYDYYAEEIVNKIQTDYDNFFSRFNSNYLPKIYDIFDAYANSSASGANTGENTIWKTILTNIPIFGYDQLEQMANYFNTGDASQALNGDEIDLLNLDWSTDWKLYVDGKEPNIKLVWESKALEEYLNSEKNTSNITLDSIKVEISQNNIEGKRIELDFVPYTNGYYKTSYSQLAEKFDMDAWDKFLSEIIGSQTGIGDIPFYFKIYYGKLYSTLCYCKIPYSTEPKDYGKVPTIDIQDNSTVTVIYGSDGSEDDGYKDRTEADELPEKGTDGTDGQDTSGLLSTVYVMTQTRLKQLASFLWSDDFFQNIKLLNNSPIENIVSCKVMPCSASGTDSPITLGNVSTGVNGDKTSSSMRVQIGSLAIPKYYNSFLDYAPYTKLTIFLPFIGFKELDTNVFMGKTLKLYYVFDFITGAVKAQIFANDIYCMSFDATAGIDIPITASNRAQVEASYIKSALSVGGSIASGNPLVAVGGLLESANAQYHYNTQGTFSPSCGFHDTRLAYVIYDRPTAQYPTTYNHNCGKPCLLSRNLGSVSGYTEVDKGIELSGIPCTESERKEILDLITTGIFL